MFQKGCVKKINREFDDAGGKIFEEENFESTRLADHVLRVYVLRDVEPRLTRARVELLLLLMLNL